MPSGILSLNSSSSFHFLSISFSPSLPILYTFSVLCYWYHLSLYNSRRISINFTSILFLTLAFSNKMNGFAILLHFICALDCVFPILSISFSHFIFSKIRFFFLLFTPIVSFSIPFFICSLLLLFFWLVIQQFRPGCFFLFIVVSIRFTVFCSFSLFCTCGCELNVRCAFFPLI